MLHAEWSSKSSVPCSAFWVSTIATSRTCIRFSTVKAAMGIKNIRHASAQHISQRNGRRMRNHRAWMRFMNARALSLASIHDMRHQYRKARSPRPNERHRPPPGVAPSLPCLPKSVVPLTSSGRRRVHFRWPQSGYWSLGNFIHVTAACPESVPVLPSSYPCRMAVGPPKRLSDRVRTARRLPLFRESTLPWFSRGIQAISGGRWICLHA